MEEHLKKNRDRLVREWIDRTLEIFPSDSAKFLRGEKDPFSNPVGSTISTEIGFLFDAFVTAATDEEIAPHLDNLIRVTCIQEVAPSRAISFIFQLKGVIRRELAEALEAPAAHAQLARLEARIDRLALCAFDSYARLRERISEIRLQDVKNRVSTLVKMAGVDWDDLPGEAHIQGGNG